MIEKVNLHIVIFLVLLYQPLFAADPSFLQTEEVTVVFDEALRSVAQQVAGFYPSVKQELEKIFQWDVDFRPTLVLIKNTQKFRQIAGTDLIVAFALPHKKAMVIDYSKMHISPFSLKTTVKHELCHLLLHHYIDKTRLPKWLDEGVCQWASDGVAEVIMDAKRSVLNQAIISGRVFRMHELSNRFPREKQALQLAYAQSKSLVDYIGREFGREGILHLLNSLRSGSAFEPAVEESFSMSFEDLEKEWLNRIRKKNTWFTYLSIHIYEFLFLLGAVIVVIGFVRLVIKKRAYRDWDED